MYIWTPLGAAVGTVVTVALAFGIPLLLSSALREAIAKYIASFVQHRFDRQIEGLKSELRKTEELFKSELNAKERQINSIAESALSLRSSRHIALDARRLAAVEKLWASKAKLDTLKLASSMGSMLKPDVASGVVGPIPDDAFKVLSGGMDQAMVKDCLSSIESERPFLDDVVWASFAAYRIAVVLPALHLSMFAAGIKDLKPYLATEYADKTLMAALPEWREAIEKYGARSYPQLHEALELKLLAAVRDMLDGKAVDATALAQASEIITNARKQSLAGGRELAAEQVHSRE